MHVTRIELSGFKSFADKVTIEFPRPSADGRYGITAIVGPNGSGKSNVADAIRWVLGEQSMKHLRGKKSEDIIFAGSDGKGKMGLASVAMVLDNSDHRAPVEYDELVISRRLYRSGESEYLLNGNKIRLSDLQLLLARAQFGQGSYSVIGQGTIDRLLLQSPSERKVFFDEAVGIKEFQLKRHHASLKLARTEENITQAQAILTEIEPHLRSLKRQATKLEQRQQVEISLRELQESYYRTLFQSLQQDISLLETERATVETDYRTRVSELQHIQTELARIAQEKSRTDIFDTFQSGLADLQRDKNILEKERAVVQGKLETEYGKAGKHDLAWLENKVSELSSEGEDIAHQKQSYEKQVNTLKQRIDAHTVLIETKQREKILAQQEITKIEYSMREMMRDRDTLPVEGLRAVHAIVSSPRGTFGGTVHGMVAELARVDDQYRTALEVAAVAHLASVVVENDSVAEHCISFLKQGRLGFATFLPLNTIRPRFIPHDVHALAHHSGVLGLAVDLVSFDPLFQDIFSYVFGSTLIVEDITVARRIGIGKVRMVTLEGDVIETSGSLKGGYRKQRSRSLTFSARVDDFASFSFEDAEQSVSQARDIVSNLDREIDTLRTELASLSAEYEFVVRTLRSYEDKVNEHAQTVSRMHQELSMHTMSPAEYTQAMKGLETERDQLTERIHNLETQIAGVHQRISAFNHAEETKQKRVFALQDQMQQSQQELNTVADTKHACDVRLAKFTTQREALEEEVQHELKHSIMSVIERDVPALSISIDEARSEIEKLKYTLSLIGGIDEEVLVEYRETSERYENLRTQLDDLSRASIDLNKMITELDAVMKKKRAHAFKKIKKEFSRYFSILFDGGKAELIEIYGEEKQDEDQDDMSEVLEEDVSLRKGVSSKILTGIDVVASPPGKKIKHLAALSGGERTLTSIALLCAILHTNPSPFVLLDEVEAALDEANTLRFTKILQELASETQFIIITHNRVTMHASDVLYGVTMGGAGVSRLVSVQLDQVPVATT